MKIIYLLPNFPLIEMQIQYLLHIFAHFLSIADASHPYSQIDALLRESYLVNYTLHFWFGLPIYKK